jgi:hypothetical protein
MPAWKICRPSLTSWAVLVGVPAGVALAVAGVLAAGAALAGVGVTATVLVGATVAVVVPAPVAGVARGEPELVWHAPSTTSSALISSQSSMLGRGMAEIRLPFVGGRSCAHRSRPPLSSSW